MINTIIITLFGIIIGSFLNVCICRIPKEESIIYPKSHCIACNHHLSKLDLIPILSFLYLRGRCRYCGEKISIRYMLIEILTGLVYGMVYFAFGFSIETIMYMVFTALLIVLTMIDCDYMILPTKIIIFGGITGIGFRIFQAIVYRSFIFIKEPVLAALIGYVLFYTIFYLAQRVLKKEGLGFGDVRLIAMIGIYLSVSLSFLTIFLASVLASVYGVILLYIRKKSEPFPFGPFINLGAAIAMFYGEYILSWYLRITGM